MREIKFRAWYQNKMCFDIEKHHVEHHSMSGWSGDVWDFSDWLKYSKVTQYTGLKDKNGKEIYEGDILINNLHGIGPFFVRWANEFEYAGWSLAESDKKIGELFLYQNFQNLEVIGNIFENPELIKTEI
jgi:uncharacterized phage protein (TIGR01671 family)